MDDNYEGERLTVDYTAPSGVACQAALVHDTSDSGRWWEVIEAVDDGDGHRHTWEAWVAMAHKIIEHDIKLRVAAHG